MVYLANNRHISASTYMAGHESRILDRVLGQEYNGTKAQGREGRMSGVAIPYSSTVFGGLQWYSVLIVGGILLAIWLAGREEKRLGLPKDTAIDIALVVIPCGIVGARLYYVAMTWELFSQNPISILYIWEGGIAIYGAVIGGALGALVYARRKKVSFLRLADMIAPGLLLAQAIGRWGNYFNMEAYGPLIKDVRFQFFPLGVLIPGANGYAWHMATFFYESMWNFVGFGALWALRTRQKEPGSVFCWYLLIYGSGRFIIEQLREDSLYLGGLRVSQYLSLILCAVAAGVLLWRAMQGRGSKFAVAGVCAAAWLGRWFCLGHPWLYGALAVVGLIGSVWLAIRCEIPLWRVLAPAVTDVLGLAGFCLGVPFSASFAGRLNTLLCSLTLPCYVAALCIPKKTR